MVARIPGLRSETTCLPLKINQNKSHVIHVIKDHQLIQTLILKRHSLADDVNVAIVPRLWLLTGKHLPCL